MSILSTTKADHNFDRFHGKEEDEWPISGTALLRTARIAELWCILCAETDRGACVNLQDDPGQRLKIGNGRRRALQLRFCGEPLGARPHHPFFVCR